MRIKKSAILLFGIIVFQVSNAYAMLGIRWQLNTQPDVTGYRLYIGFEPGKYENVLDLGNNNLYLIQDSIVDTTYYFSVTAYNQNGIESQKSEEVNVFVPPNYKLNERPRLYSGYPNPFVNQIRILYFIPENEKFNLTIFNMLGKPVFGLNQELTEPGLNTMIWNGVNMRGESVAAGVYLVALTYDRWCLTKKIILAR